MTENYLYPNIRQSVWIFVLLTIVTIGVSIILEIIALAMGFPSSQHPASIALTHLVAFGLVLAMGLKRANSSLGDICPLVRVRLSLVFPMVLTVIGTGILLSEIDNLLRVFLPVPVLLADLLESLVGAQESLWGSVLALVVIAPLAEELLVRGLILRGFLSHYTTRKAIIASAIFFGLMHLNPWQFIGATTWGILFAWWFIQTRSIVPCLFGHALVNAVPLIATAVFRLEIPGFTGDFGKVEFQPLWFNFLGIVLAALGIWLLIYEFRKSSDAVPADVSGNGSDE